MVLIKKRNFKPYVLNWLIPKLGVGTSIGNIFYMAPASSAAEAKLKEHGVPSSEIFATTKLAHAACTANQNDVVLATIGTYNETVEVPWSKSSTHLVGMAGVPGDSDYTMDGVQIYTETITVADVLHVTGNGCQFHNIAITNNGANAACLGALKVAGYGNKFIGSTFKGIMNATQMAVLAARSVLIASLSSNYLFDNCTIGNNNWATRTTAYQGHVYYGGTTESSLGAGNGPQNGIWKNCMFYSYGTTITAVMVRVGGDSSQNPAGNEAMDRTHTFNGCHFDNWYGASDNLARINSVFDDACLSYHHVRLIDCSSHGYGQWRAIRSSQGGAGNGYYSASMVGPGLAAHPGEGVEPTS